MRKISEIIIHCSDSAFGDWKAIDEWHRARGWDSCGYHFVILNGIRKYAGAYAIEVDGYVERGRPLPIMGAHCYGKNQTSIGICLIGRDSFTSAQIFDTLPRLLVKTMEGFNLEPKDVFGHYEFNDSKTCPNLDINEYRKYLKARWDERK